MKDWDAAYKEGRTPWDKGKAAPPLVEFLLRHTISGRVLVPGSGTGHDVRLIAAQGADVLGLDISPRAHSAAISFKNFENANYRIGDFLHLSDDLKNKFDWLVEHTCLCAIDPDQRANYVQSARLAIKVGGHLLAIFFREVQAYDGSGPPHPITSDEIQTLFAEGFVQLNSFTPSKHYESRPHGCEEVYLFRRSDS
ncbi:MAG: TPMT family class I SAM-dependent methyltransferase [Puniceicoccaceae bacterium]|nr:TPMT family class I SAM-dependent methyltransferase [Puniceicoccaceae bacterium]